MCYMVGMNNHIGAASAQLIHLKRCRWSLVRKLLPHNVMSRGLRCHSQGLIEERDMVDANGRPFAYALVSRRSRLHPGMRYIARGLNALASPGNELECEQVGHCNHDSPTVAGRFHSLCQTGASCSISC